MNEDMKTITDLPMYKKRFTEEDKRACDTLEHFIDWFAPNQDVKSQLASCLIVLAVNTCEYRDCLKKLSLLETK